jgi:VCBS repeat-containing protein
VINAYCGATYVGEDTFTGIPIANACNTAPVANNDSYSGEEDTPRSVAAAGGVLANDTDAESNPLTAEQVADPAHGSLTLNANGSFSYTPAANYCGSDSFTYKAYDGALYSNVATVSIAVACVNDAPVLAAIGDKSVNELAALTLTATDPDSPANTLTFGLVDPPAGAFSWTPASSQIGEHNLAVKVCDNGVTRGAADPLCDEETVKITVQKRPTALVYSGTTSAQYSDRTVVQATLADDGGGSFQDAPLAGKTIGFTIGAQSTSATTDASGLAKGSILLDQPAATLAVVSSFAGGPLYLGSSDSDPFEIAKEAAEIAYTGDT